MDNELLIEDLYDWLRSLSMKPSAYLSEEKSFESGIKTFKRIDNQEWQVEEFRESW